jgi:hypothetical protein
MEAGPVDDDVWQYFTDLLGQDPSEVVPELTRKALDSPLQLAALALTNWNVSMTLGSFLMFSPNLLLYPQRMNERTRRRRRRWRWWWWRRDKVEEIY